MQLSLNLTQPLMFAIPMLVVPANDKATNTISISILHFKESGFACQS